jgi:hypothetical protein
MPASLPRAPPGLLALEGVLGKAWVQVTPGEMLPWLDRASGSPRLNTAPLLIEGRRWRMCLWTRLESSSWVAASLA